MKTQSEIMTEAENLIKAGGNPVENAKETNFFTVAAVAGQALAWVMGEDMSPSEMLTDEKEGAQEE